MHAFHSTNFGQFHRGLQEQFLLKGITHLNGWNVIRGVFTEILRCKSGPVNTVSARRGAHNVDCVAYPLGLCRNLTTHLNDACGEGIDQRVLLVALIKIDLAAHRGDAEGVAVVSNALDHPFH